LIRSHDKCTEPTMMQKTRNIIINRTVLFILTLGKPMKLRTDSPTVLKLCFEELAFVVGARDLAL
jgi:hypothetical protein